jgi:adenine-specific DNA-methyltransferase
MRKSKYSEWTKEELIKRIDALEKRKKYGLVWDEEKTKEKFEAEAEGKFPVLKEIKSKEIKTGPEKPTHILIEGDNYHALSVLNYTHEKAIDVIFIDPPYNTGGNEHKDFKYNDSYVDREDAFRHSKWLSFMYKRIVLAKKILKNSGLIFITIDDNEFAQLKLMCDDIFGEKNFVMNIVWQSRRSVSNDAIISQNHNYILFYARNKQWLQDNKEYFRLEADKEKFNNPDNDPKGPWVADPFDAPNIRPNLTYPIKNPNTKKVYMPPNGRCWRTTEEQYKKFLREGRIIFGKTGKSKPQLKRYLNEIDEYSMTPTSWWDDVGTTTEGTKELIRIFGEAPFNNPKPTSLMEKIIDLSLKREGIILDFFAGSGSTGNSVLNISKFKNKNHQVILCTNNENSICENVTYPRMQKLLKGFKNPQGEKIEGYNQNLKYYKTAFVSQEPTDKNRELLTKEAEEMLCLRENTFELVLEKADYKIYKNSKLYLGIVWNQMAIDNFKKEVSKYDKNISVYVFSLSDEDFNNEFADMKKKIKVCSIPEAILRVYRRIFTE